MLKNPSLLTGIDIAMFRWNLPDRGGASAPALSHIVIVDPVAKLARIFLLIRGLTKIRTYGLIVSVRNGGAEGKAKG